jgi:hypothetical protein
MKSNAPIGAKGIYEKRDGNKKTRAGHRQEINRLQAQCSNQQNYS